jgi:hypothetical protein
VIRTLIIVLMLGLPALSTAAAFTMSGVPEAAVPGIPFTVGIDYEKPGETPERRLVFLFELHRASDDGILQKFTLDNSNLGYKETTLHFDATFTIPPGTAEDVYVALYAVPWSLNRMVVEQYKSYPTDGTFTYLWSGGGYGVTQNVYYLGSVICPKPSGNTTYCSGLAFETAIVPYNAYNTTYGHPRIGNMTTASQMESFRKVWYGVTDAEKLAARAIPEYGIGVEITDFEEAQEGDFVQLWRHSGSGHNPLFVNWVRDGNNTITGVRYWGTQSSTNGIGSRQESFGVSSGINPARFYLGRLRKPRDQADYLWAISTSDTKSTPTRSTTGEYGWTAY